MTPYADPRWQKLRLQRMDRDGWACVCCGDSSSTLHVHHKIYRRGEVWESPLEDLQTLCERCHSELGPHPKGGIWWSHKEDESVGLLHVEHCPKCRGTEFGEFNRSDFRYMCWGCGHYVPFGRRPWISFTMESNAAVPVMFGHAVVISELRPKRRSRYEGMTVEQLTEELERLVRQRRQSMGIRDE